MTLRAHILAILGLTLATSIAGAADLLEVYKRAQENDPQIREAEANRLASLEAKPQARAALLPTLTATGQQDRIDSESQNTRADVGPDGNFLQVASTTKVDGLNSRTYGFRLTQTIFRWDRWAGLARADKQVAQAEVDYKAAEQDLLSRTAQRYFDVLAAADTLKAAQASLEAFSRQLEQADKRFEVGLIAITDVQEARAARDQASASVIAAKRSVASSQEFLRELTGEAFRDLSEPGADMPLKSPDPASEDQWVRVALEQNLSLISARLQTEIAKEDVRVARAGHLPTVDLVAQRSRDRDDGEGVTIRGSTGTVIPLSSDAYSNTDSIGIQVSVPIFAGGATQSQVRQRVYLHRAARERSERTARETERATRDAYLGVISEISRVQALRQALESSQTALQATEAGFEVGTRTTVDVLDARRRLFDAQTNYARSRYDYIINVLNLKVAAGGLSETDLAEVNSWLTQKSTTGLTR